MWRGWHIQAGQRISEPLSEKESVERFHFFHFFIRFSEPIQATYFLKDIILCYFQREFLQSIYHNGHQLGGKSKIDAWIISMNMYLVTLHSIAYSPILFKLISIFEPNCPYMLAKSLWSLSVRTHSGVDELRFTRYECIRYDTCSGT